MTGSNGHKTFGLELTSVLDLGRAYQKDWKINDYSFLKTNKADFCEWANITLDEYNDLAFELKRLLNEVS